MTETHEGVPLFPLSVVLFPGMILPLHIFEPRYKAMIGHCLKNSHPFGVVLARMTSMGEMTPQADVVGTLAQITRVDHLEDGRMDIETVGLERFRVLRLLRTEPYTLGDIRTDPLPDDTSPEVVEGLRDTAKLFVQYLRHIGEVIGTNIEIESVPRDALAFAYLVAMALQIPLEEKQELLSVETLARLVNREKRILQREGILLNRMRTAQETNTGYIRGQMGYISLN